jgi:hypothetical protein
MTDKDLKIIAGTDAALYIIFNRYAAIFFMLISLFNSLVFIPIYVTGDPANIKEVQDTNN